MHQLNAFIIRIIVAFVVLVVTVESDIFQMPLIRQRTLRQRLMNSGLLADYLKLKDLYRATRQVK
jgi:hypothetical protein